MTRRVMLASLIGLAMTLSCNALAKAPAKHATAAATQGVTTLKDTYLLAKWMWDNVDSTKYDLTKMKADEIATAAGVVLDGDIYRKDLGFDAHVQSWISALKDPNQQVKARFGEEDWSAAFGIGTIMCAVTYGFNLMSTKGADQKWQLPRYHGWPQAVLAAALDQSLQTGLQKPTDLKVRNAEVTAVIHAVVDSAKANGDHQVDYDKVPLLINRLYPVGE